MQEKIDHDQIFKTLIKEFFREFMELFFPTIAGKINFGKVEFIEQEFFTDLNKGRQNIMDLVAKVGLIGGGEEYILIHTEFESKRPDAKAFPKRMFNYFCQLFLRFGKPVIPIVIFSDDRKWQKEFPDRFDINFGGNRYLDFFYHTIRLKNMKWSKFLKQDNPLAYALMAKMDLPKDKRWRLKADFLRWILGAEINPARRSLLLEFIETYVKLNNEEQKKFDTLVETDDELTEVTKMITVYEERGIHLGELKIAREDVIDVLKTKFKRVPRTVRKMVNDCEDLATLKSLLRQAVLVKKVEDLKV